MNFQFKVKAMKNWNSMVKVFQGLNLKSLEILNNYKGNSFKVKGKSSRANQCFWFKVFQGQPLKILKFQGNFKGVVFNDFVLPSCSQTSIWEFQELSQDSLSVLDINLSRIFVSNLQSCKRLPLGILFITGPDFTTFRSF